MLVEIEDPKGNRVFKKNLRTGEFGIASVDFQLADEINHGNYQITCMINKKIIAQKTVQVKRYVLPKFKIEIYTDKRFYRPLEKIKGSINAYYFFGKPVDNAGVTITAKTYDVEFREFARVTTRTDKKGTLNLR
jgi:uncharacterized protein YfaS (alpha-2-macroglobulin family)